MSKIFSLVSINSEGQDEIILAISYSESFLKSLLFEAKKIYENKKNVQIFIKPNTFVFNATIEKCNSVSKKKEGLSEEKNYEEKYLLNLKKINDISENTPLFASIINSFEGSQNVLLVMNSTDSCVLEYFDKSISKNCIEFNTLYKEGIMNA
jgi:hypothetical protein